MLGNCPIFRIITFLNVLRIAYALLDFNQYISLKNLYYATNGSSWSWNATNVTNTIWNFSVPRKFDDPCKSLWNGVVCNALQTKITSLNLSAHNLKGSLHYNQFFNLSSLCFLDISKNSLYGQLPTFSMLKNLTSLDISSNSFDGFFSNLNLTALNSIQYLNFSFNKIKGRINLREEKSNLKVFDAESNSLTGTFEQVNCNVESISLHNQFFCSV